MDNIENAEGAGLGQSDSSAPTSRPPGRPRLPDIREDGTSRRRNKIPETAYEWQKSKQKIPRTHQAIFMLLTDKEILSPTLERSALDVLPETKHLSTVVKDELFKFWPHWNTSVEQVKAISQLKEEHLQQVLAQSGVEKILRRREGLDGLSLVEQLKVTSSVYVKQIQNAALSLAAISVNEVASDELTKKIYETRVKYLKDFSWIEEKISSLASRMEQAGMTGENQDDEFDIEAADILDQADKVLLRKGIR